MNLEQLLEIAYRNTDGAGLVTKIYMSTGWAINMKSFLAVPSWCARNLHLTHCTNQVRISQMAIVLSPFT